MNQRLIFFYFSKECAIVNEICCKVYNNHEMWAPSETGRRRTLQMLTGDKIVCTKNNDVTVLTEAEGETNGSTASGRTKAKVLESAKERLMNGSVYVIKGVY
jgi:hypothetical protein